MPLLELSFASKEDSVSVRHFAIREEISHLFEVAVLPRSPNDAIDLESIVGGKEATRTGHEKRSYDVFHVEEALGSPYIPAQREFVIPYRIASVVGFGGLLRTGEMFAVVLFSRAHIPAASAARFRAIALDIRSSLFSFDENSTWRVGGAPGNR